MPRNFLRCSILSSQLGGKAKGPKSQRRGIACHAALYVVSPRADVLPLQPINRGFLRVSPKHEGDEVRRPMRSDSAPRGGRVRALHAFGGGPGLRDLADGLRAWGEGWGCDDGLVLQYELEILLCKVRLSWKRPLTFFL